MILRKIVIVLITSCLIGCNQQNKTQAEVNSALNSPILNLTEANRLAQLPLHCIETEYPYRLGQTLGSEADLLPPKTLHPAFYGCFDWHSAVHGHWSLVSLLRQFPGL